MEIFKALALIISVAATILGSFSVEGQIRSPCTASMLNNFTPCFNVITGSSSNGSAQKESCCTTLKSLSGVSMDCACLLLTANVPVPLPINAVLTLILPSSCNLTNLPAQCKATGSPLPSPGGPVSLGPTAAPPTAAASPLSPQVSEAAVAATPAPEISQPQQQLTPASPPVESQAPSATTHQRIRPVLTPSASAAPSCLCPPSLLLLISIAMIVFKSH